MSESRYGGYDEFKNRPNRLVKNQNCNEITELKLNKFSSSSRFDYKIEPNYAYLQFLLIV